MTQQHRASLIEKIFEVFALGEWDVKEFYSSLRVLMHMLSQIDSPKTTPTKFAHQTIPTNLLTETGFLLIWHLVLLAFTVFLSTRYFYCIRECVYRQGN